MLGKLTDLRVIALFVVITAVVAICCADGVAAASPTHLIAGDADCGGTVDGADVLTVLRDVGGVAAAPCSSAADVNCDGKIDATDVLRLLLMSAGIAVPDTGCPAIGATFEGDGQPTSLDLIDAAAKAGALNEETALMYRVFALFDESRLPVAYQGAPAVDAPGSAVVTDLALKFSSLSQQVQDTLLPYLLPPGQDGSWFNQKYLSPSVANAHPQAAPAPKLITFQPDPSIFQSEMSASGKYKVWWLKAYPQWSERARSLITYLDGGIYNSIASLMGREPLGDGGLPVGDDAAIDIIYYEAPSATLGVTYPVQWVDPSLRCKKTPGLIAIDGANTTIDNGISELELTIAHEMFHAAQFAFDNPDCLNSQWVYEGTAKWFEDYLYPGSNANQYPWRTLFAIPSNPIDELSNGDYYSTYVFFMYLTKKYNASVIRTIFEQMAQKSTLLALDAAMDGGWNQRWPEFAAYMWNAAPLDYFKQWDGISYQSISRGYWYRLQTRSVPIDASLDADNDERKIDVTDATSNVKSLARDYYLFSTDPTTMGSRKPDLIQINNPMFGRLPPYVRVQLEYHVRPDNTGDERWVYEDMSGEKSKTFCRSNAGENVDQFVVIISNSDVTKSKSLPSFDNPIVTVDKNCGWAGEAHRSEHFTNSGENWTAQVDATDLVFVPSGPQGRFQTVSGKLTTTVSGTFASGCTIAGSDTHPVGAGDGTIQINSQDNTGLRYQLSGLTEYLVPYVETCPGSNPINAMMRSFDWVSATAQVSSDLLKLEGKSDISYPDTEGHPGGLAHYSWKYTRGASQ